MDFLRARNEDQKKQRLAQILEAASDLFADHEYKDITMEMIAGRLNFSRANMSRYVASKEEIFLLLYLQDVTALYEDLQAQKAEMKEGNLKQFSQKLAEICEKHQAYLRIGSILNTVIELNIEVERLAVYKKELLLCMSSIAAALSEMIDFLDSGNAMQLVWMFNSFMAGLYPVLHLSDVQKEAMDLCGLSHPMPEFTKCAAEFILLMLNGIKNGANEVV